MLNLSEQEVVLTTDDLKIVYFSQCVDGKGSIVLNFSGDPNEYQNAYWLAWEDAVRKNSVEPLDSDRVIVSDEAFIFQTGTFKLPNKAQIGITATYDRATRTVSYNGAIVRINFTSPDQFNVVKGNIEQSSFWQNFGIPMVIENLTWKYVIYKRV